MERTFTIEEFSLILYAVDDMIDALNEEIGRFLQYSEESENVEYKKMIRKAIDQLDQDRTEFKNLRSRLMSSGR